MSQDQVAALDGITVVDLSEGLAGAICTLQLADAGAIVIKVERPDGNLAHRGESELDGTGALSRLLNRDKRSIALDVADPEVRPILEALLGRADVVVTDFTPRQAREVGWTYEELRAANPAIIHCSLTPYGDRGPYAERPATELELQGVSSCQWFLGQQGQPPVRVGADIVTVAGAMQAFLGISAALLHRASSGLGQQVSVSLLGSMLSFNSHWMADFSEPDEYGGGLTAPYDSPEVGYATADRPMALGLFGRREDRQAHFLDFCRAIGLEALLEDEWMVRHGAGYLGVGTDAQQLKPILEDAFAGLSSEAIMEILIEHGGAGAPFMAYTDLFGDELHPQVAASGVIQEAVQPDDGSYRAVISPWAAGGEAAGRIHTAAPAPGADTDQVLGDLGYDGQTIRRLGDAGKIG